MRPAPEARYEARTRWAASPEIPGYLTDLARYELLRIEVGEFPRPPMIKEDKADNHIIACASINIYLIGSTHVDDFIVATACDQIHVTGQVYNHIVAVSGVHIFAM